MRSVLWCSLFYWWGNWSLESLTKAHKSASGDTASEFKNWNSNQSFWLQKLCFISHLLRLPGINQFSPSLSEDFILFHFCLLSLCYLILLTLNKHLLCARHNFKRQGFKEEQDSAPASFLQVSLLLYFHFLLLLTLLLFLHPPPHLLYHW